MSYMKRSPCKKYLDKSTSSITTTVAAAGSTSTAATVAITTTTAATTNASNKEELRKSLSAKFVPFRRSSDTTSESSDDFKMDLAAEDVSSSSFSRSSSESYSYAVNARYQHQHHHVRNLNNLTEIGGQDLNEEFSDAKMQQQQQQQQNETLDDFRWRLNSRRKVKTRYQQNDSQDDEKTDNSCDSATTKAHGDVLRYANRLKQGQVTSDDISGGYGLKKTFHYKQRAKSQNTRTLPVIDPDESMLLNEFDSLLNIDDGKLNDLDDVFHLPTSMMHTGGGATKTAGAIVRSSTENFTAKNMADDLNKIQQQQQTTTKSSASPRFKRKTQVLKAASSIPSLIFSNKSFKQKMSTNSNPSATANSSTSSGGGYEYSQHTLAIPGDRKFSDMAINSDSKKNSIDEDVFQISVTKARRSPLRILGNLVDDKIFRGRWSTAKRAKSTDEITWALANEDNIHNQSDAVMRRTGSSKQQNRKKSFAGLLSTNPTTNTGSHHQHHNQQPQYPQYPTSGGSWFGGSTIIASNKKQSKSLSERFGKNPSPDVGSSYDELMNQKTYANITPTNRIFHPRKPSNSYSEILTVLNDTSGMATTTDDINDDEDDDDDDEDEDDNEEENGRVYGKTKPSLRHTAAGGGGEIKPETLAEIEAFEKMIQTHLTQD